MISALSILRGFYAHLRQILLCVYAYVSKKCMYIYIYIYIYVYNRVIYQVHVTLALSCGGQFGNSAAQPPVV